VSHLNVPHQVVLVLQRQASMDGVGPFHHPSLGTSTRTEFSVLFLFYRWVVPIVLHIRM
jgi:hypothetical protein